MHLDELLDAFFAESEELAKGFWAEGFGFGGALDLNELAGFGHDHIHVGAGLAVFFVAEVKELHVVVDANADGCHRFLEENALDHSLVDHPSHRVIDRDVGGRDGGGSGAAVGSDGVAVDGDCALAHGFEVDDGAEGSADEPLDFLASTVWSAVGVALVSLSARAGKHRVLGGDPASALTFHEWWDAVLDGRRDEHMGVSHLDEAGAFSKFRVTTFHGHRSEFVRASAIDAHMEASLPRGIKARKNGPI